MTDEQNQDSDVVKEIKARRQRRSVRYAKIGFAGIALGTVMGISPMVIPNPYSGAPEVKNSLQERSKKFELSKQLDSLNGLASEFESLAGRLGVEYNSVNAPILEARERLEWDLKQSNDRIVALEAVPAVGRFYNFQNNVYDLCLGGLGILCLSAIYSFMAVSSIESKYLAEIKAQQEREGKVKAPQRPETGSYEAFRP